MRHDIEASSSIEHRTFLRTTISVSHSQPSDRDENRPPRPRHQMPRCSHPIHFRDKQEHPFVKYDSLSQCADVEACLVASRKSSVAWRPEVHCVSIRIGKGDSCMSIDESRSNSQSWVVQRVEEELLGAEDVSTSGPAAPLG